MRYAAYGLLLALSLSGCEKITAYEPPAEKRQGDADRAALEDAKALYAKGDVVGAHARLGAILLDSPLRKQPDFVRIENDWARAQIAKGKSEKDPNTKRAIFDEVARNEGVSAELRAEATTLSAEAMPQPSITTGGDFAEADAVLKQAEALLDDPKRPDPKAATKLLLDRVRSGKATAREVDMLLTLCVIGKDKECTAELQQRGLVPPEMLGPAGAPAASGGKPTPVKPAPL